MKKRIYILSLLVVFLTLPRPSLFAATQTIELSLERETEPVPKKSFFVKWQELRERLEQDYGTYFAYILNYTQQVIAHAPHDEGKSRGAWYFNLELMQEFWQGASLDLQLEVDKNKGVDKFLPTFALFNSNAGENASLYIPQLYLEQKLFKDKIAFNAGKLDLSNWFDVNAIANSADEQFNSDALVNSLVIPFPSKSIGAMINYSPKEWLYFQAGAQTAKASATKVGLSDAFNSAFFIGEFGLSPKPAGLQGNYRFMVFLNREKVPFVDESEEKRNNFGFSLSFDQELTKRAAVFLRYGFNDKKTNIVYQAWSAGVSLLEPIRGRKEDRIAVAVAQSLASPDYRRYNGDGTGSRETMLEAYYSIVLNKFAILAPNIQLVLDPEADTSVGNELVAGSRLVIIF